MTSNMWMSGIIAGGMIGAACASAKAWEIPLDVREGRGKGGLRYVTSGVPLLPGQAGEAAGLTLARRDAAGKLTAVPSQMRVLARWWAGDNSIRWLLVDFQTDIGAKEQQGFVLTDARLPAAQPPARLTVDQTDDAITITTGPARFVVPRRGYTFLRGAAVDANGDGQFAAGEELLDASSDCGTMLEDCFGQAYTSGMGTTAVEVIEAGPMRVRVRARGVHKAPPEKGYSRGMYQYDVFMDFFAGSASILSDVVLGNNFQTSIGAPAFEDASLWLALKDGIREYNLIGDKLHAGQLAAGQSVCLYQDSNGADTWNRCQGYNTERQDYWRFPEGKTASFRGYKLRRQAGDTQEELAAGNFARGTALAAGARGGVVVHMLNFWQQFPKGVELFADGRLRVALFPKEYKVPHSLKTPLPRGMRSCCTSWPRGCPRRTLPCWRMHGTAA